MKIRTVTGWIDSSDVKFTYVHEHLYTTATQEVAKLNPNMRVDDLDKVMVDLHEFKELGGNLIVDVTTQDYGRELNKLRELSEKSGVYIVATGGFNKGKFNREFLEDKDPIMISQQLVDEINADIGPGILKIGTSENKIEPWELIGLKAISLAHLETGAPITTHTEKGTFAREQLDLFIKAGVDPRHIILGHLDQNSDFDLHLELIKSGAFLGYDSIPKVKYNTKDLSIDFITRLAKLNLHTHIVLSGDFARKDYYHGFGGQPGLSYLIEVFKKELELRLDEEGLDSRVILNDLFIHNPASALSFRRNV